MSSNIDKANDLGIDSLKLVITIASGSLVLTVTFLKDILADQTPIIFGLLVVGWVFLFLSVFISWIGLATATLTIGEEKKPIFLFSSDIEDNGRHSLLNALLTFISYFIPTIPTKQTNQVRKYAASAQNYLILGLLLLIIFSCINYINKYY